MVRHLIKHLLLNTNSMLIFYTTTQIVFWVVYYLFESLHDANIIKQTELNTSTDTFDLANKYNSLWHMYDAMEKLVTHTYISVLTYVIYPDVVFCVLLYTLGLSIRLFEHDFLINYFRFNNLHKAFVYVGVRKNNGMLWDMFLNKIKDKTHELFVGIIRLLPFVITLLLLGYFILFYWL